MSNRIASTLFAAALAATLLVGPNKAHAGLYTSATALQQGELFALDPMFASVGWLAGTQGDNFFVAGSGVLIDPHWLLTAGHVLTRSDNSGLDSVLFSLSTSIFTQAPNYAVADTWYPFPGYSGTTSPGRGNDIGLIHLVDPVVGVIPADRFYGTDQEGTHVYTAGYGRPGIWPNVGDFDGVKRAGENIGDCFGCLTAVDDQYWLSDFSRFSPLPLEWMGAPGDSGGAWFAEIDGRTQLVGITAFTRGQDVTGAIRVSLYNDWIDATIASHQGPTPVPEPSSIVLFGLGMLGVACSRRTRRASRPAA